MRYFSCVIADRKEIASIPVLEIEESAFAVLAEIVTLEVIDPVKPFGIELQLLSFENLSLIAHCTVHEALDLIDYEVGLES